jgi:hypothetical protein
LASITVIDPQNVTVNVDPPPSFTVNIDTAKQGPGLTPNGPNLSIQYRSGNGVTGSSDFVVNPSNGQAAITSIYSTGNIQASYFLGNGSQLTGIASAYGNANVAAYLPTYTGNLAASSDIIALYSNAATQSNAIANLQLAQYSNANTAAYLQVLTSNVSTTANISASYYIGNGSQLTGLPQQYSNANVAAYLPTYTGNLQGGNLLVIDSVYIQGNLQVQGNTTYLNSNVVNIDDKDIVIANGATTLTQANGAGFIVGQGNLANVIFNNPANAWMIYPGIATPGNITGTYIFGNGSQLTGLPALYGNANVAAYLPTYTGDIGAGNINVTNDIFANYITATYDVYTENLTASETVSANNFTGGNITVNETVTANNVAVAEDVSSNTAYVTSLLTVGGNLLGADADFGGNVSVGANIISNNVDTNAITATGNITAAYVLGNVRDTTGINSFADIAVAGQTTVTADSTTDTLTLVAGTNITITTDAANNRITITSTGGGGGETFDPFLLAGM